MTLSMAKQADDDRLTLQEAMSLTPLLEKLDADGKVVKRYMSYRSAWIPGSDLPPGKLPLHVKAAYGGHVYSQAGTAASRAFSEMQAAARDGRADKKFGLHTIHGYFSEAGLADRPFIYDVSTVAANPSFVNLLVTARQPTSPSTSPEKGRFQAEDAYLPLGPVCFTAIISLRPAGLSQLSAAEPPPQDRFSSLLGSRPPLAWPQAPIIDIASVVAAVGRDDMRTTFPGLEMRKVDLSSFNAGRPLHERRELVFYRLLAPLKTETGDDDVDAHILAHAYEADRNGLLMVGNHSGFGFDFGRAASLSYSFVVHVNPEGAVMRYSADRQDRGVWWVQEACFPRVEVGRCIVMSKIWSPEGVHVATEYQDGIIRRNWRPGEREGKL